MPLTLHRAQGDPRRGLPLALSTALLWGFLAIALRLLVVEGMDAFTITWYRLTAAALLLGAFQWWRGRLPALGGLGVGGWSLLGVAIAGLTGNYVLFVLALGYVPPATAQVVVQLAPLLFLFGGLVIFGEPFSRRQWTGLTILVCGLLLFFNQRLGDIFSASGAEAIGVGVVILAAIVWAAYALAQKQLLSQLSSQNILLLVYCGAALVLLPVARPAHVFDLSLLGVALLAFGIFNTLAAYGCFAKALEHWEASRVSAVLSLTPLLTLAAVYAILVIWPDADIGGRLDTLGHVGAVLVVTGSMTTALGRRRAEAKTEPVPPE
jgi:drug/metabolite transporter (DMT)-like permease